MRKSKKALVIGITLGSVFCLSAPCWSATVPPSTKKKIQSADQQEIQARKEAQRKAAISKKMGSRGTTYEGAGKAIDPPQANVTGSFGGSGGGSSFRPPMHR